MEVSVSFTPAELEARDPRGLTVVVIDCLRASTSMVAALHSGARAIYPLLTIEEARSAAHAITDAVLAGERGGAKIPGFDLGNSPSEFTPEAVHDRNVVMTTTNGTRTLVAAARADIVFVGAFVNCSITADAAGRAARNVLLAAAGTEGYFSIEDVLCAGAMSDRLAARFGATLDDSALCARLAWRHAQSSLADVVLRGRGASNVLALGLGPDVDFALRLDSIALVVKAVLEPLRVILESHSNQGRQES